MGGTSGQRNKGHKHGKHSSKSDQKEKSKGRVLKLAGVSRKSPMSIKGGLDAGAKSKRMQQQQARVKTKRDNMVGQLRLGRKGAPKIVGFVPIGDVTDQNVTRKQLQEECDPAINEFQSMVTMKSVKHNQNFTFVTATDNQQDQLDLAKVADIIVFVIRVNTEDDVDPNTIEPDLPDDKTLQTWYSDIGLCINDTGRQILSAVNCQGLPSVCVVLQGLHLIPSAKKRRQVEKVHLRYFQSIMTSEVVPKVFSTDTPAKAAVAMRYISEQKIRPLKWRDIRPYFLVDSAKWKDDSPPTPSEADGTPVKQLCVSGYLRGKPLKANQLVHLTNYGTYQIERVVDDEGNDLSLPTEEQENLQYCQVPDPMEGEQTWPTEEEIAEAAREERRKKRKADKMKKVKVPAGFSSYQAAWVADPAQFEELDSGDDEDEDDAHMDDTKSRATTRYSRVSSAAQTDVEEVLGGDWLAKDEAMTDEERAAELLRLREASQDDRDFPDEVDTPMHIPSRMRFQKYRGLQSFRSSEWDPNEALPIDYARIFKFQNFRRTQKIALALPEEGAPVDTHVTVILKAVPVKFMDTYEEKKDSPLCLSGLLKHEQKYTVVHFLMQRNKEYDEPIKSKTRLVIHVGFRKVVANPIYSDVCKGDRTKFARYFHADDRFIMMSFFGPACYSPTPALCFQPITRSEKEGGAEMPFVSFGASELPNPDLLVLKKIVLTGHVFKTHKRQCIVRYLFHNEEDVKWFQPVEIYTKLGFRGRIIKSVGTHGYMKATFSGIVQGHDVVCMDLWKRVYPKWTTAAYSNLAAAPQDETSDEEDSDEMMEQEA